MMRPKVRALVDDWSREGDIPTDVLGSYTGMSREGERPVQDADDL